MVDQGQIQHIDRADSNDSAIYDIDDDIYRIHYNFDNHLDNEIIYNQYSNNNPLSNVKGYVITLSLSIILGLLSVFAQYLS